MQIQQALLRFTQIYRSACMTRRWAKNQVDQAIIASVDNLSSRC